MDIDPKRKVLIFSIAAIIGVFAFGGVVTNPILRGIVHDHDMLISEKTSLAQMSANIDSVEDFRKQSVIYAVEFAKIPDGLIDPSAPIAFIEFLEELALDSRVDLKISPGTPRKVESDLWPFLNFELQVNGPYSNLVHMLEKLEDAPYFMEIEGVGISQGRRGTSENAEQILGASITLKVYTRELK